MKVEKGNKKFTYSESWQDHKRLQQIIIPIMESFPSNPAKSKNKQMSTTGNKKNKSYSLKIVFQSIKKIFTPL